MTEPRKTPRTDREWAHYVANDMHDAGEHFARSLEIETQELALALAEYANTDKQRVYHRSGIGTETAEGTRYARAIELIARHRAKLEGANEHGNVLV